MGTLRGSVGTLRKLAAMSGESYAQAMVHNVGGESVDVPLEKLRVVVIKIL